MRAEAVFSSEEDSDTLGISLYTSVREKIEKSYMSFDLSQKLQTKTYRSSKKGPKAPKRSLQQLDMMTQFAIKF